MIENIAFLQNILPFLDVTMSKKNIHNKLQQNENSASETKPFKLKNMQFTNKSLGIQQCSNRQSFAIGLLYTVFPT